MGGCLSSTTTQTRAAGIQGGSGSGSSTAESTGRNAAGASHSTAAHGPIITTGHRRERGRRRQQAAGEGIDFGHSDIWASEHPITESELLQQREAFWDTAPAYEGRAEIWQAVRLACEIDDSTMAAVILESAGVSVPTGRVADGVYDERGACYVVPRYCLSKPRNLVRSRGLSGTPSVGTSVGGYWQGKKSGESADGVSLASSAGNASLVGVPVAGQVTEVTVRLAVGKDVSVKMGLDTTVAAVERELKEEHHVPPNARVRFFHLGRSLDPASMPLRDLKLGSAGVIQAMYS